MPYIPRVHATGLLYHVMARELVLYGLGPVRSFRSSR